MTKKTVFGSGITFIFTLVVVWVLTPDFNVCFGAICGVFGACLFITLNQI